MTQKIIWMIVLVGVMFVGGCNTFGDIELIEPECTADSDCEYRYYNPKKCIDNECVGVECMHDGDCNMIIYTNDYEKCINNTCVSFLDDCVRIAKSDYNMTNPDCSYIATCHCEDYIIDSPERRIVHGNSTQIISEQGHHENYVMFEINKEAT